MTNERAECIFLKVAQQLVVPSARAPQQAVYGSEPTVIDFTKERPRNAATPATAPVPKKPRVAQAAPPAPGKRDEVDDMLGSAKPVYTIR